MPGIIFLQAFLFACLMTIPTIPVLITHYIHSQHTLSWKKLQPFLVVVFCSFGLGSFVALFALVTEVKDDAQINANSQTTDLTGAPELPPHAVNSVDSILPWTHKTDLGLSVVAGLALFGLVGLFVVPWIKSRRAGKRRDMEGGLSGGEMAGRRKEARVRFRSLSV